MINYNQYIEQLSNAVSLLEEALEQQLLTRQKRIDEIKKMHRENVKLKKQYKELAKQVQECISELQSIKKLYGKS